MCKNILDITNYFNNFLYLLCAGNIYIPYTIMGSFYEIELKKKKIALHSCFIQVDK